MRRCTEVWSASLFALLLLSVGDSHARLPTPPQAQRDLLVLTVPAPQGSRAACWVPHFSKIIRATAVGLPQECFLTTASVTGTNRKPREGEWRKRRSYQLAEMEALQPTQRLLLVGWSVEEHKTHWAFNLCFMSSTAVAMSPTCPQALGPACREFKQRTDTAISYVSEHAGAGGDTGLCLCCVCTFVYTCNQMDSSRSNESEGGIAPLRSRD